MPEAIRSCRGCGLPGVELYRKSRFCKPCIKKVWLAASKLRQEALKKTPKTCLLCGYVGLNFYTTNRLYCKECIPLVDRSAEAAVHRERRYLDRFGITIKMYDEMLEAQGGACRICGKKDAGHSRKRFLDVDHCHETGLVRGLLCSGCNIGLGKFYDNPDSLRKAADYLEAANANKP